MELKQKPIQGVLDADEHSMYKSFYITFFPFNFINFQLEFQCNKCIATKIDPGAIMKVNSS